LKGSIIDYVKGEIRLNNLLSRIKRCLEPYTVALSDIKMLLDVVIWDPALNLRSPEERCKKLDILLRSLNELMKGV